MSHKKNDQFAGPCAGKLIFPRKTLGCSVDWTPEHKQTCPHQDRPNKLDGFARC